MMISICYVLQTRVREWEWNKNKEREGELDGLDYLFTVILGT